MEFPRLVESAVATRGLRPVGVHISLLKPSVGNSGVLAVRGCKQASYVEGIT